MLLSYPRSTAWEREFIPKRRQPGKWRLILDLSFPLGRSVNDGIPPDLCSLQFTTVDKAAQLITRLGRGALLAKIDISHAYRNVPVHPDDRRLLGMAWNGSVFVDTTLPFGLRSAPKIFCAISDALEWVLCREGVSSCLHYIDDFLTAGVPNSMQCAQNLQLLQSKCHRLGLPLATEKIEGPAAVLTFLGVEFDTDQMQMRLPQEKLDHLQVAVSGWLQRKAATKREMLSLIGELAHACKVVEAGRTFLRRLLDLAHSRTRLDHWIRINADFKSDLLWWHCFLKKWNGQSLISSHCQATPEATVFTDASGAWGCGAVWIPHWFQVQWSHAWLDTGIAAKELVAVALAIGVWSKHWAASTVLVRCDNMAVVEVLKRKTSHDKLIMHMLRSLHFLCAVHNIRLSVEHIRGVDNILADALSRNNLRKFFLSLPKADSAATPVPDQLQDLFMGTQPDWTCFNWRSKLQNI